MALGEMTATLLAFRVLKAHGLWAVGDIRMGDSLAMRQAIRTGMVERAPEDDQTASVTLHAKAGTGDRVEIVPAIGTSRRRKKDSDGEASV